MTEQTLVSEKLTQVATALKAGLLNDYAPAAAATSAGPNPPTSWGSAMRR